MSATPAPATGKTLSDVLPPERVADLMAFRRAAEAALPGRVAGVVLFGSRARGDADADSDYDVAVMVTGLDDRIPVRRILSDMAYGWTLRGVHLSPRLLPARPAGVAPRSELEDAIAAEGIAVP